MLFRSDIAGREVQLDKLPKTFVVANYIANFLMVGGAGSLDKVVGMTFDGWEETRYGEYVVYTETFPKLKAIPSIGGYHDNILDSEKILSLRPDVLLVGRSQFADNNQKVDIFEKAGIKVVVLDYHAMKVENHTKSTKMCIRDRSLPPRPADLPANNHMSATAGPPVEEDEIPF